MEYNNYKPVSNTALPQKPTTLAKITSFAEESTFFFQDRITARPNTLILMFLFDMHRHHLLSEYNKKQRLRIIRRKAACIKSNNKSKKVPTRYEDPFNDLA